MTPATNAAAQPVSYDDDDDGDDGRLLTRRMSARQSVTHETFLTTLDDELKKMDTFAHREVVAVRAELRALEAVDAVMSLMSSREVGMFLELRARSWELE